MDKSQKFVCPGSAVFRGGAASSEARHRDAPRRRGRRRCRVPEPEPMVEGRQPRRSMLFNMFPFARPIFWACILSVWAALPFFPAESASAEPASADSVFEKIDRQEVEKVLTPAEKGWLSGHPAIRVAGPKAFPPFHYYDSDGVARGMAADYVDLVLRSLDIQPKVIGDLPWPTVLALVKEGKIDLIACSAKTAEREPYLEFTEPFMSFPLVIIAKIGETFIGGLDDLYGRKVAFVKGTAAYDWVVAEGIAATPVFVNTPQDALFAVSTGEAEAYIGNLAATTYLIEKNGLKNLKIAAPTSYGNYDLYVAVRKDWPELASIVDKTFSLITPQQHAAIRSRWLSPETEFRFRKIDVVKWVLAVVGVSAILLAGILFWNRRLQREIRERERAETALRKSEETHKFLTENMADIIWTADMDLAIQYVSPSVESVLGFSPEERMRQTLPQRVTPESLEAVERAFREAFPQVAEDDAPDCCASVEAEYYRKDGTTVWLENRFKAIRDDDGKLTGILGVSRDIGKRRKAERKLRKQNAMLSSILESAAEGICVCRKANEKPFVEFTLWNRKMEELTGYSMEEINRLGWQKALHPQDPDAPSPFDWLSVQGECAACVEPEETVVNAKDGTRKTFRISMSWLRTEEGHEALLAIVRDVTEKKKLESQLLYSRKMEAVGTMAGGIAHEFNNMLSIIMGNAELAVEDIPEGNVSKKRMEKILKTCLRARDVVARILRFATKTPSVAMPIRISRTVEWALKLMRATIPSTVDIRTSIFCDSETILADPAEINQVIVNLCKNAVDAMGDGPGVLTVTLDTVDSNRVAWPGAVKARAERLARLVVEDDGAGIAPEDLDRVFDPYFSTKTMDKGMGMGLAVVYGIVSNSGGHVKIESQPGRGTKVEVFFPLVSSVDQSDAAKLSESLPLGQGRILLVDDEESIVTTTKLLLERLGYEVTGKTRSLEALETFSARPQDFDLVLTDMAMPMMNGDRLAKKIREIRPGTPVVLCTGYGDRIDQEKIRESGVKACCAKPLRILELGRILRTVLKKAGRGGVQ